MDMLNYAHQAHMQDASINCSDNDSTTASQRKGTKSKNIYEGLTQAEKKQRRTQRKINIEKDKMLKMQKKLRMEKKRNNLEKLTSFFCPFCKLDTDKSEELLEHIKRLHFVMRECGESLGCPECIYMKCTRKAHDYMTHCHNCNPEMFTEAYIPPENSSIVMKLRNERMNITTNMKYSESPGCSSMEQEEDDGNQDPQNSGKSDLSKKKRKKINIINILEDSSMKIRDKRKLLYDDRSISHNNYGCPKCNKRCIKFEALHDHYRSKHL